MKAVACQDLDLYTEKRSTARCGVRLTPLCCTMPKNLDTLE